MRSMWLKWSSKLVLCGATVAAILTATSAAEAGWGRARVSSNYSLPSVPVATVPATGVVTQRTVVRGAYRPVVVAPAYAAPAYVAPAMYATPPTAAYYAPTTYAPPPYVPPAYVPPATTTYYAPAAGYYPAPAAVVAPATTTYYRGRATTTYYAPSVVAPAYAPAPAVYMPIYP